MTITKTKRGSAVPCEEWFFHSEDEARRAFERSYPDNAGYDHKEERSWTLEESLSFLGDAEAADFRVVEE